MLLFLVAINLPFWFCVFSFLSLLHSLLVSRLISQWITTRRKFLAGVERKKIYKLTRLLETFRTFLNMASQFTFLFAFRHEIECLEHDSDRKKSSKFDEKNCFVVQTLFELAVFSSCCNEKGSYDRVACIIDLCQWVAWNGCDVHNDSDFRTFLLEQIIDRTRSKVESFICVSYSTSHWNINWSLNRKF